MLDISVFPRTPGLDEQCLDVDSSQPLSDSNSGPDVVVQRKSTLEVPEVSRPALNAEWETTLNTSGAQPGDSRQARSSSQPPAGQKSETDRLAAEQAEQLEALGYLQGSVKATVAGGYDRAELTVVIGHALSGGEK